MISELDDVVPRPILVMTRIATDPQHMAELLEMAEESAPVFASQPGFMGSEIFKSTDETRLVGLVRWRREEDHLACLESPDFAELNEGLEALLGSGQVRFEAHVLVRVGTIEPARDESPDEPAD
jgi:heme-degrading monooxygenase HmoA